MRRAATVLLAVGLSAVSVAPAHAQPLTETTDAALLPDPGRTEVGGARWGRFLVVAGGLAESGSSYAASNDLFLYDLRSEEWSQGPDLPGVRDHAPLVVLGKSLYLVGGYTATLSGPTREVWKLARKDGEWERVADMNTPRGALAVTAVKGHLVAIGGVDESGVLRSTEIYDPKDDEWSPGPDLATAREHLGAAAVGKRVYAIGGRNPDNQTSVEMLVVTKRGARGEWQPAPALQFSRGGNGASTAGGLACTAGGEEQAGTIPSIECLVGDAWVHVADLRIPRHGLAVIGEGKSLHVIAGGPQPGAFYSTAHEVVVLPLDRV